MRRGRYTSKIFYEDAITSFKNNNGELIRFFHYIPYCMNIEGIILNIYNQKIKYSKLYSILDKNNINSIFISIKSCIVAEIQKVLKNYIDSNTLCHIKDIISFENLELTNGYEIITIVKIYDAFEGDDTKQFKNRYIHLYLPKFKEEKNFIDTKETVIYNNNLIKIEVNKRRCNESF